MIAEFASRRQHAASRCRVSGNSLPLSWHCNRHINEDSPCH